MKSELMQAGEVATGPATAGDAAVRPAAPDGPRRAYRAPRLVCHGTLIDLTEFGGSQAIDSGASSLGNLA
ncbi:MAG TPA: hypothetical protein VF100_03690 [Thermoanaerobaculia bacterium]